AGGVDHILAAQLLTEAGVPAAEIAGTLNYIPYSGGGESLAALLGNNVDAGISGVGEYAEQVNAGTLKALAVSSAERSPALPDVPTPPEQGIDLVPRNWRGVVAPGGIEEEQAEALTQLVTDLHDTGSWGAALEANNWDDAFLAGDDFAAFLREDIETVRQTLADIGLVCPWVRHPTPPGGRRQPAPGRPASSPSPSPSLPSAPPRRPPPAPVTPRRPPWLCRRG